jgi:hypothetical protein
MFRLLEGNSELLWILLVSNKTYFISFLMCSTIGYQMMISFHSCGQSRRKVQLCRPALTRRRKSRQRCRLHPQKTWQSSVLLLVLVALVALCNHSIILQLMRPVDHLF